MTDKLDNDNNEKTLPAPLTIHPAPLTLRQWTDDFQARIGSDFDAMKMKANSKNEDYQSFQCEIEEAFGP